MADVKINQLPEQTAISDTDVVIIETLTSTNKMTVGNFKELIGAVVESGSNENGRYVKYGDGTIECFFAQPLRLNISSGVFSGNWNLPIDTPQLQDFTCMLRNDVSGWDNSADRNKVSFVGYASGSTTSSSIAVRVTCIAGQTFSGNWVEVNLLRAIGRWK